ncbi:MAG: TatD family deoxyribonuclease [Desulfobacterales bacterium CG07_land_8_20_14_0_80_52_14]|nr:MAG: hydrolase TatD [Desulfobacterales bacterium CG23_combo_of_CG06-09_8_20_14_all_52_9]PIU49837.1 MAG: TatD family deoxyribonuclease [Desulfobacterales bacterium CG07_land_8_20_14_0_80_52_14]
MRLFDSHCHLDDRAFDPDIDAVIARARDAGVASLMVVGIDDKSSQKAVRIAQSDNGIFASVGVHPHDSKECSDAILNQLRDLSEHPKVKAWGEIGLDYNRMFSPKAIQEKWFERQLEIALDLDLPVILHERDTRGRLMEILSSCGLPGKDAVVHCFSGTAKELTAYIDADFYIGVTGILTLIDRGSDLRSMIPMVSKERLLVETDAPYLTPYPEKKHTRRNEPAFVKSVLLTLAQVRKEDPKDLADAVWENTCRLYRIVRREPSP